MHMTILQVDSGRHKDTYSMPKKVPQVFCSNFSIPVTTNCNCGQVHAPENWESMQSTEEEAMQLYEDIERVCLFGYFVSKAFPYALEFDSVDCRKDGVDRIHRSKAECYRHAGLT